MVYSIYLDVFIYILNYYNPRAKTIKIHFLGTNMNENCVNFG